MGDQIRKLGGNTSHFVPGMLAIAFPGFLFIRPNKQTWLPQYIY
ncbi:hypothetical protein B6254_0480 [Weissella cibaria]|uniref:Uncharacterized protein n=1 Tax=Weissella cibaria TaxID=137591 RepID=A0A2S1KPH0_9LACO|nr:hypothetical protein B6254_0480 [Weissella cibaria]